MKNIILLLSILFSIIIKAQNDVQIEEEKYRDDIDVAVEEILMTCGLNGSKAISLNNNTKHYWEISEKCYENNKTYIIKYHQNEVYFEEIYITQNDKLFYIKESETRIPLNSFEQIRWNNQYYFKNGLFYTNISLGHGKTEDENWNENDIIVRFNLRIQELNKLKR